MARKEGVFIGQYQHSTQSPALLDEPIDRWSLSLKAGNALDVPRAFCITPTRRRL